MEERTLDRRAYLRDGALALAMAAVVAVGALVAPPSGTRLDALGYALLLVGALSLAARRPAPVAVVLVTTACLLGYYGRGYPGNVAAVPALAAVYTAVRAGHRRVVLAPAAALAAVVLLDIAVHHAEARVVVEDRTLLLGWLVAAAAVAMAFREWEAHVREAEERALDAERTRDEVARRRAVEERLRIARELHDSLTHTISVIKVQAGVAVHLARKRGEQVPEALLAIQEASGEATRELRTTLGVLRDTGDATGAREQPATGLDRLPDLVERARSAGLPVTLTVTGERRPLPADIERAAYRIVQEALTNVTRHAGPAAATIRLDYQDAGVAVQVDDDGLATPAHAPVPGVGLLGMRERVSALGGRLRAEPRPEGGFRVRAELPAEEAAPA
jgi:signal transduction histidine kinase